MKNPFKIKIPLWIILIFALVWIGCHHLFKNFDAVYEKTAGHASYFADWITIAGFIAAAFAIADFVTRKSRSRLHALTVLHSQLEVIGHWSSYHNGGFSTDDQSAVIDQHLKTWGNPFHQVFNTETTGLQTIWSFSGITDLPENILKSIAPLNQEILNFNSCIENINRFKFSGSPHEKIAIHLKLNGVTKEALTSEERNFVYKLTELYALLHFEIIGDYSGGRLHQKHRDLFEAVSNELRKYED